jgi:tRNA modification GTPase
MSHMLYEDTIAAIATPPGEGGLGIVRISGPQTLEILEHIFLPARPGRWKPFRLRFGRVVDPSGHPIDEGLGAWMRAPRSFTGEDSAEISCHGGPLVLARVLEQTLVHGARLANPGEFTMRAFLNGRIDLTQAEATLDVITARTTTSLALAQSQLGGWISQKLRAARAAILAPLAYCTALVDFPEDEVEPQPIAEPLHEALAILEQLLSSADQGIVFRQGARAAIVGRPNAGKSSLLNALLRADRAIVTPIPGTTRDTLEETASLDGIPVVLIDTAGIAETNDPVEQIGVGRSHTALNGADLALLVVDAGAPLHPSDREIAALTAGKPAVLVLNKVDLLATELQNHGTAEPVLKQKNKRTKEQSSVAHIEPTEIHSTHSAPHHHSSFAVRHSSEFHQPPATSNLPSSIVYRPSSIASALEDARGAAFEAVVETSALRGEGLGALGTAVARLLLGGVAPSGAHLVTNARQRDALSRAVSHVRDAIASHARGTPHDLIAVDMTAALSTIGEITGEAVGDDLLHEIFSRFCIGK